MRTFALLLIVVGALGRAVLAWAEEPPVLLGGPDSRPTLARPFGWRGDGSGRFPGATPVTNWSATKNVRWSTVVGRSYSSPILTDKLVLVMSEPNLVVCVNRADGKVRWKLAVKPAALADPKSRKIAEDYQPPKNGSGLAAATPLTDGRNVYAVFANGIVCAVDLDGQPKWVTCIEAEQNTGYGRSSSPIIVAGKLVVHLSHLYALDPATGTQLWVNTEAKSSYGTPIGSKAGDIEIIVTPLGDVVRASDGTTVNSGIAHTSHSSPIPCGAGVVCFGDSEVHALRLNEAFKDEEVWNGTITGDVIGSPLVHDHTLFITTGEGELFTFDTQGKSSQEPLINGRKLFENTNAAVPAVYASITLAGRYLFLNSNQGEIVVLKATRQAPLVSRNRLPAGNGSSPVFSGKDMFLRDGNKLFCIGE